MKSIKKLKLENESSFKIIENGLSSNQLSQMELATLRGGSDYGFDPTLYACGIEMCGAQGCGIQ